MIIPACASGPHGVSPVMPKFERGFLLAGLLGGMLIFTQPLKAYVESWPEAVPSSLNSVSSLGTAWFYHMGLNSDGSVALWGNVPEQLRVPPAGMSFKSVSGGAYHAAGLLSNGLVVVWGENRNGEAAIPAGLSNVVAISAGQYHTAALKQDGTVATWGQGNLGQLNVPAGLSNVVSIAAANYCTLALRSDGTVVGWGNNAEGILNIPASATNIVAISAMQHCLALRADGTVLAWGGNGTGQATVPPGLTGIAAVSAGASHSVVLRSNGTIMAWGGYYTPPPPLVSGVTAIAANGNSDAVLTTRPQILIQPVSVKAVVGVPASLSVSATGVTALAYQWYRNGAAVLGAIAAAYPIPLPAPADAGSYYVVITDTAGAQRQSDTVNVTVNEITVLTPPLNIVTNAGANVSFSVVATSAVPVSFQWSRNGTNLTGATANTLVLSGVMAADAGTYQVTISAGPTTLIQSATLTVITPPSIVSGPSNMAMWADQFPVPSFSVIATGTPPLIYQWYRDGNTVPGATGTTYTPFNGASFWVRISNGAGSVTSAPVSLTVNSVAVYPLPLEVYETSNATYSVVVVGGGTIQYQWQKNSVDIPGATSNVLTLEHVSLADSGTDIRVRVTNGGGSKIVTYYVPGAPMLIVKPRHPVIGRQPSDVETNLTASPVLSVEATGTGTLNYQWRHEGTNVAWATSAELVLTNLQPALTGRYDVVISDTMGAVTSSVATVSLVDMPAIFGQPQGVITNVGVQVSFTIIASNAGPILYQWLKDGTPLAGQTSANLTIASAAVSDMGGYQAVVTSAASGLSRTSLVANLNLYGAPIVLAPPTNVTGQIFGNAFLSITATSSTPVSFTWRKSGVAVPGGDGPFLVFNHLWPADAGTYDVIATTAAGSITSSPVTLVVDSLRPAGTVVSLNGPIVTPGLTNAISIASGPYMDAAMKPDGTMSIWSGRLGYIFYHGSVAAGMTNIVSVAASDLGFAYALNEKGEILNWANASPTGMTNARAFAVQQPHSLTILSRDGSLAGPLYFPGTEPTNVVDFCYGSAGLYTLLRNGTVQKFLPFGSPTLVASNAMSIAAVGGDLATLTVDGHGTGPLAALSNVVAIAGGSGAALLADGSVMNAAGSTVVTGAFAISGSDSHVLVLTTNPPSPAVSAKMTFSGVKVSATISVSGYYLESAPAIGGPYSPVILWTTNDLLYVPQAGNQFFRMHRP